MTGRNQFGSNYNEKPDQLLSLLKVRLPHSSGNADKDLTLTMGLMNDINTVTSKVAPQGDLTGKRVVDFFSAVKNSVKGVKGAGKPEFGEVFSDGDVNVWRSKPFDQSQLERYATMFGSRMMEIEGSSKMTYEELLENYPDFAITQPLVVVAQLREEGSNAATLNPKGTNTMYQKHWNDLKGKSIVFISDVYELPSNDPQKMLEIYIKQLDFFNSDKGLEGVPFRQLSPEGKERYIRNIAENQEHIVGRNGVRIEYRPRLVQMLKIDNPVNSFLDFRERFIQAIKRPGEYGTPLTASKLEQFNTSIYVKDRLIKSLRVISQFLSDSKENRDWFKKNVLRLQNNDAQARIDELYEAMRKEMGDQFIETATPTEYTLKNEGLLTLDDFMLQLDQLFDKDTGIIRGKFATTADDNSIRDKQAASDEVTRKDLTFKLTEDKQKDFGGNLIDIRMFNLLKQTRNLNFAELIDLSLTAFSNMNGKYAKYNLGKVFKGGQIEGIVLATKQENIDYTQNPLAPAITYPAGFRVGVLPTHPSYNFDFNFFIEDQSGVKTGEKRTVTPTKPVVVEQLPDTEETGDEVAVTDKEKIQALKDSLPELVNTDLWKKAFAEGNSFEDAEMALSSNSATVLKVDKLTLATPVAFYVESGEVIYAMKVEDMLKAEMEKIDPSLQNADTGLTYMPVSTNSKTATFTVEHNGSKYELEYNLDLRKTKVTPMAINQETSDPMEVLRTIEQKELKSYKDFITEKFGEKAKDKSVKPFLDLYEQLFRYTMLTANIGTLKAQSGTSIDITEYDSTLEDFDIDTLYSKAGNLQVKNMMAWRTLGVKAQIDELLNYADNYKPNYC